MQHIVAAASTHDYTHTDPICTNSTYTVSNIANAHASQAPAPCILPYAHSNTPCTPTNDPHQHQMHVYVPPMPHYYSHKTSITSTTAATKLKIAHVNICSLRNKVKDIQEIIYHHNIDILGVTETWLDRTVSDSLLFVPNYILYRKDRSQGRGGGVCYYVRDTLAASVVPDSLPIEAYVLIIGKPPSQLSVVCVYRPPGSSPDFWQMLSDFVDDNLPSSVSDLILVGDLNVDVLANQTSPQLRHLEEFCTDLDIKNIVKEPTRTPSNTCIDLILVPATSSPDFTVSSPTVYSLDGITDHHLVSCTASLHRNLFTKQPSSHHKTRSMKKLRKCADKFKTDLTLALQSMTGVENMTLDDAFVHLNQTIRSVLDKHCPEVKFSVKSHPAPSPWITDELRQLLQERKHLHRASVKHPGDPALRQRFRAVRKQGTDLNRRLRSAYYQDRFHAARCSPRQHWRILNLLLGRYHIPATLPVEVSELTSTFANQVTDQLFVHPLQCPSGPALQSALSAFSSFSAEETQHFLQSVDSCKATGPDGLPPLLLKLCADELADPMSQLFSESLSTGHFPTAYKFASVVPVYKKGCKSTASNYRPISVLPVSSKLLERSVLQDIQAFTAQNPDLNVLPHQQFAYRRQHSCEDALSLCINNWHMALDKELVTGVVLLDLSKAFDSVPHELLLLDLQACGMGEEVLQWFTSYLSGRSQHVQAPNVEPGDSYMCTRGVPQGSVLGPLLFTIFLRDLPKVLTNGKCSIYADDICLYISGKDVYEVTRQLEQEIENVNKFLRDKGLHLNELKTEFLIIRKKSHIAPLPSLKLSTHTVSPSSSARYLGLIIDEYLTFTPHINCLSSRVFAKLKAFKRVRKSLDSRACRTFYISFIQSMLEYASNAYIHCLHTAQYQRLINLSKRAQRYVFGYPSRAHTDPIRKRHRLMPIDVRFTFRLHIFVYRCLHNMASPLLQAVFVPRFAASCTSARTRSQTQCGLSLPAVRSRSGYFSLCYLAADRWNSLPAEIRSAPTLARFRSSLLSFLGYPVRRPRPVGTTLS